jgi:hypothetical protein
MAARINGLHQCKHPTRYLSESQAARAMIAQWAFEDCSACVKWARDEAAITNARDLGLPDLIGSDKQVSWARSIREEARAALSDYLAAHGTVQDMLASDVLMFGMDDAGWWITRKDWGPDKIVSAVSPIVTIALGYRVSP